jgi:hypothetical protein
MMDRRVAGSVARKMMAAGLLPVIAERFYFPDGQRHRAADGDPAGIGIGFCQAALARRDPNLERVLPGAFQFKLGVWLAMHEYLRSMPRCRAAFDGLAAGLRSHVD